MQIDWITVSAQIVNFLILVWLLKRFLYQPVMDAMARREQRIAERLEDAREREQDADEKAQRFRDKSDDMERRRDDILAKAREDAEQRKSQLLEEAREEVASARENWQRQAEQEKEEFLASLRHRAAVAIEAIARKALGDLADADLEEQIVGSFITRLESLDPDTRQALTQSDEPVRIASTFELDSDTRERLTGRIHACLAEDMEVNYSQSPELLCGIELTSGGRRLSWNLADYMEKLGARIEESFSPLEPAREEATEKEG